MASGETDEDKLSDKTFDLLCTVCKHEGRNTEAVKYYNDCSDYYCSKCVKVHDTVPVLKGHNIVDKGQSQKGSSKPLLMVPTERCDRHDLKPVDMYCENHDGVGCSTCMIVEHRSCQSLFYIPEYIQNNVGVCKTQEIQRKLDFAEKSLAKNLQHFEHEKQQTMRKKAECIQNVRKFREEINKRLDELEQASVDEIEKIYQVMISKIEEGIQVIKETNVEVTSARDKLATAGNDVSQVFVTTKVCKMVVMDAEKCLKESGPKSQKDISFIPDPTLSTVLKELGFLGRSVQQYGRESKDKDTSVAKQKCVLLQTKGMKKYPVNVQSDKKDCSILSSCVLEDGTIILADSNNSNLKRLDRSTYSVIDHYDLPGYPWQVCVINNQEVAVSYRQREVMFISLGNKMIQKSLTKTDFYCYGLAHATDNLYIADFSSSVYIYSVSGRKLKQYSKDHSGHSLFTGASVVVTIFGLAVSPDGSKMYAVDSNKGLIVLDNEGKLIGKFNGPELEFTIVTDVHLINNGNILVCVRDFNNILQFGPDGDLIGEVLLSDEREKGYLTACCNEQMSKIIVGSANNEIEVYDLV